MADETENEVARRLGVSRHPVVGQVAGAVKCFAPLGWAVHGRWHQEGTSRVLRLLEEGATSEEIDEALTEVWNSNNKEMLRHAAAPVRRWSNSYFPFKQVLWDRVSLIDKAIEHHFAGAYEASIPIIFAQIDGLSRDLTGQSFFSKANADSYMDDATLAGMAESLPVVRKVFSESVNDSGSFGLVSRHGVMHGRDLGYATKVNSTKAIVLVAALAEYFPRLADDLGAHFRSQHDERVAGVTGVDEKGRLVDDRQVRELLNFAYDFDSGYATGLLVPFSHFDPSAELPGLARKHGLEPEDFACEQGDEGVWWHYTLPAGQVLGYAARPTTSSTRRHPDVWRWDGRDLPTAPPWQNATGWHSDDDFPCSPNWEPEIVI
ncbi:hypothetical protein [Actinomyces minihominis]|uniref:hypothetical protein n=1 Tax=Actinomyces minihominis TaxID=2002838 RepID=UPI00101AE5ED|nr:hypothetical protein [Actinomyces minihominis]